MPRILVGVGVKGAVRAGSVADLLLRNILKDLKW